MDKKIKLLPPMMPNFIKVEGMKETISITTLTERESAEYGELMKQEFISHHARKVKYIEEEERLFNIIKR